MKSKIHLSIGTFVLLCIVAVSNKSNATSCSDIFTRSDKYANFYELSRHEVEGSDFKVTDLQRSSSVIVVAPHAGLIEFATSEIAKAVAGYDFSLYLFEGIKIRDNFNLHITSNSFDEPRGLNAVSRAQVAISIHGYKDKSVEKILVGGRNKKAAKLVSEKLQDSGFLSEYPNTTYAAESLKNFVNRAHNHGVQLEISLKLRDRLKSDSALLALFAQAVRNGLIQAHFSSL